jgi:protocatechuate 3,4-dioxygenase beta subunit
MRIDARRRRLLLLSLASLPAGLTLARTAAAASELPLTPACEDGPTPAQTPGPFFKPSSPERASLREPGVPGRPMVLQGVVLDQDCRPQPGALVDLWHCDGDGHYDNAGYRCRGHQFTDAEGRFRFETVLPALYPGRTRHFHVRVQAPGGPPLTTQLYFPGEPANARDRIWRRELEMAIAEGADGPVGSFLFVVESARA